MAALFLVATPAPAFAQAVTETWTMVIAEGPFSGDIYTWQLKSDGTYAEDGRDAHTGAPIQATLSGTWTVAGARMRLEQDNSSYRFEGLRQGERYSGRFMSDKDTLSTFCAWKGTQVPSGCGDDLVG